MGRRGRPFRCRFGRLAGVGLILGAILVGTTGADCQDIGKAVFMESAGSVAEGLKTIITGLIDGAVSALEGITSGSDDGSSTNL